MTVMSIARFERFFRAAAGLDVDKNDLKRYSEFVDAKLYDLLIVAQATAKANGRDIIQTSDLPITKGLQESIHHFRRIDQEVELKPILEQLAAHPLWTARPTRRPRRPIRTSSVASVWPLPRVSRSSTLT